MRLPPEDWERLKTVAQKLKPLHEKVVFLGGAVVGLLLTDLAGTEVRPTKDVDVVVDVATYGQFGEVGDRLRALGFRNDQEEGAPICRWLIEGIKVDVMPPVPLVIGFSNLWYPHAVKESQSYRLEEGIEIQLITAPLLLATKFAAFKDRGKGDFLGSHDLEDIVILVDGRPETAAEVENSSAPVRRFISDSCKELLADPAFLNVLPAHLEPDEASQGRASIILGRLKDLASMKSEDP